MDPLLDLLLDRQADQVDSQVDGQVPDWQEYLAHLCTSWQQSAAGERQFLDTAQSSLDNTLVALAETHYEQLIRTSDRLARFQAEFEQFGNLSRGFAANHFSRLDMVVDGEKTDSKERTDGLENPQSEKLQVDEKTALVLLKGIDRIQDILEIPSLVLTCVRNGYYAEALDLAGHTKRLALRYSSIAIVQSIQADVTRHLGLMVTQLLQLLRQPTKPATLVKLVSYLRQLPPFQDMAPAAASAQIRLLYLLSRTRFIQSQLDALAHLRPSPVRYLKRYIEVFREHVYPSVQSFRSIFPDQTGAGDRALAAFVRDITAVLAKTVGELAPEITDPASRSSLWLQLVYCTQSLGRVGADFWPAFQTASDPIPLAEWLAAEAKQRDIALRL